MEMAMANVNRFNTANLKEFEKYETEVKSLSLENKKLEDVKQFSGMEDNISKIDDDTLKNYTRVVINNSGTGSVLFNKTLFQDSDKKIVDDDNFSSSTPIHKVTKTGVIVNLILLFGMFANF